MGHLKIRKLQQKQRLFSGKSDHKHIYSVPLCVEVQRVNESGGYLRSDYYHALRCSRCTALELGSFLGARDLTLPLVTLKSTHKWRLDKFDFTPV